MPYSKDTGPASSFLTRNSLHDIRLSNALCHLPSSVSSDTPIIFILPSYLSFILRSSGTAALHGTMKAMKKRTSLAMKEMYIRNVFPNIGNKTHTYIPCKTNITYIKPESAISPPMLLFRLTKGSSSVFHTAAVILPPASDRFNMLHIAQKMENNNMP